MEILLYIIILLPLAGGALGYFVKQQSMILSTAGVFTSFLLELYLVVNKVSISFSIEWLPSLPLNVLLDNVSSILIVLVTFISALVHVFSKTYMEEDHGKPRYFLKLGFFTTSMLGLLVADHLILFFVFWELVGLASYLLIGFWYQKDGVPASARLAFMVNRIADVALLIGIILIGQESYALSSFKSEWLFLPSILIAIGAFGKSAQFPFSGWLTKAMVGPTPVSALIHAATMVAAGVYLIFRVAPYLHADSLLVVAIVGTVTALYGGVSALMQNDVKKVLAYSTISQLGYMFIGLGVGARDASLFHLFTHAFFKAGLFLGAGAIIHFMHKASVSDAQNMRIMGGLRKKMPWTYVTFLICSLALAGVPFFSGFMSKEGIIVASWEWASSQGMWAYLVPDIALITAFLTALYVGRMVILIFWGETRLVEMKDSLKESVSLKLPLLILALGSFWLFFDWNPFGSDTWLFGFLGTDLIEHSGFAKQMVMFLSLLMTVTGLVLAFSFFKPGSNYSNAYANDDKSRFPLVSNGFYLNSLYMSFGKSLSIISTYLFRFDQKVVDGAIHMIAIGGVVFSKVISLVDRFLVDGPVNFLGYLSKLIGKVLAGISSRDLQTQLAWLLIGIILILSCILFL